MAEPHGPGPGMPQLACPGCGSPDVNLGRGLLCGTCAATAAAEGDDAAPEPPLTPLQEHRRAFRASLRTGGSDD